MSRQTNKPIGEKARQGRNSQSGGRKDEGSVKVPTYAENPQWFKYISPQGQQNIRNFKYKGGSLSYSYKYLWSPIAELILKFFPWNIAPNLITLCSISLQLSGCLLIILQTPLSRQLHPYSMLFYSFCIFTYQMLDNVDGKQARRTGSSSPLGMLFDHGCDALGAIWMGFAFGRIIWVEDEQTFILGIFISMIFGFYFSVWAQYHSGGVMTLGRVNAPDDGIPVAWMLGIFTFFMGQQWFKSTKVFGSTLSNFLPKFTAFAVILQLISLMKHSKKEFQTNIWTALSHFIHAALIICSLFSVLKLTDWHHEQKFFYQIFFSLCLCFVRDTTSLQVCVVSGDPYNQWSIPTCIYIFSYPVFIAIRYLAGFDICSEGLFVNGVLAALVLQYVIFITSVIKQISRALGVGVFYFNQKQKKRMIELRALALVEQAKLKQKKQ